MNRLEREKLLLQAHKAMPGAENDFQAADGYRKIVYAAIQEAHENNYPDVEALRNDYRILKRLCDELFMEEIARMSGHTVVGGACYAR